MDSAASVSMMDLSVEAEAFGCTIRFSDDEVPTVTGQLISTREEAEALGVPAVGTAPVSYTHLSVKSHKDLLLAGLGRTWKPGRKNLAGFVSFAG